MYREPTTEDLEQSEFKAIWDVIKEWDINIDNKYRGYCSATEKHAVAIMDGLKEMRKREE